MLQNTLSPANTASPGGRQHFRPLPSSRWRAEAAVRFLTAYQRGSPEAAKLAARVYVDLGHDRFVRVASRVHRHLRRVRELDDPDARRSEWRRRIMHDYQRVGATLGRALLVYAISLQEAAGLKAG